MKFKILLILMMLMSVTAACGGSDTAENDNAHSDQDHGDDEAHDDDHDDMDMDMDMAAERIPNEGRIVRIISPANRESFAEGEEIELKIETENFDVMGENNDWHYYVNDKNAKMVEKSTDVRIRDLKPGEHTIKVFIGSNHVEFEEGDSVIVTVE